MRYTARSANKPYTKIARSAILCSLNMRKIYFCAVWRVKISIFVQFDLHNSKIFSNFVAFLK